MIANYVVNPKLVIMEDTNEIKSFASIKKQSLVG